MYPTDIAVPRGTFSIKRGTLDNEVALNEKGKKWLETLGQKAEREIATASGASKGPAYGLFWFWKSVEYFAVHLPKKPVSTSNARQVLSKQSRHFNHNSYDCVLRILFKIK